MAEVLAEFDGLVEAPDGREFEARVCGRPRDDGHWEGWIEFLPLDESDPLRTARETTQPNRKDLDYWAGGLTVPYLEGALKRALSPEQVKLPHREVSATPAFEGPAEHPRPESERQPKPPTPVLDPFEAYGEGEDVLRGQLQALDEQKLRDIAQAHNLLDASTDRLREMSRSDLSEAIVRAVRARVE